MLIRLIIFTLIKTIIIEEICLFLLKERKIKIYIICLITNILTNVTMNLLLQCVSNYYLHMIVFEVIVFLIEVSVYYLLTKNVNKSLKYSLVCNMSSLIIGMFI